MRTIFTNFRCDEPQTTAEPCVVDFDLELPIPEYVDFCKHLDEDYGFISEATGELVKDKHGLNHCMLILCEGRDDGILVKSEGYNYARYHAYLPRARQIMQMEQHPSLDEFNRRMVNLVDRFVEESLKCQLDGQYRIDLDKLQSITDGQTFDNDLFAEMLSERREIRSVEMDYEGLFIEIAPEYVIQEDVSHLRKLTQQDLEIMCAKHTLWLNDAGGECADFSNCLLDDLNLNRKNLNNAIFDGAKIVNCDLSRAELCFATFRNARIHCCILSDTMAEEAVFKNTAFRSVECERGTFTHSNFSGASFCDCRFSNSNLTMCCLDKTDFGDIPKVSIILDGCSYEESVWKENFWTTEPMEEVTF